MVTQKGVKKKEVSTINITFILKKKEQETTHDFMNPQPKTKFSFNPLCLFVIVLIYLCL